MFVSDDVELMLQFELKQKKLKQCAIDIINKYVWCLLLSV